MDLAIDTWFMPIPRTASYKNRILDNMENISSFTFKILNQKHRQIQSNQIFL